MSAPPTTWGPWRLDRERLVLDLYDDQGRWLYELDLERCGSAAAVLDWLVHVSRKGYAPEVAGHLVVALRDLLDPRTRLYSAGINDSARDENIAQVIRANETQTRAWRLTLDRMRARCREHELVAYTAAELFATHDRAVQEVRDELDATERAS
jgi:hypothetical protein